MKTRGIRTFGALFLVLLFLMGAWAVHPGWSAQAQGKKIWGIVRDAGTGDVVSADVTLTDVHSLETYSNATWGGIYEFQPPTGYYTLKVTATDYFDQESAQPFRYDGTELLQFDFWLTPYPLRDKSMNVLVTEDVGIPWNEDVYFPRTVVTGEDAVLTYNSTRDEVTLSKKPVVHISSIKWEDSNPSGEIRYLLPYQYQYNQWAGTVVINDSAIVAKLDAGVSHPPYSLIFVYTYTVTTAKLNHTPILPTYAVQKNGMNWSPGPDWTVDINEGTLTIHQNFTWGTDTVSMQWESPKPIAQATVALYNITYNQHLSTLTTNASGGAGSFSLWPGEWEIRTSKPGLTYYYDKNVTITPIAGGETIRVLLPFAVNVTGVIADSEGPVTDGVVAFLYSKDTVPLEKRVLKATVNGAGFRFKAYPGNYNLIVDADWHEGKTLSVTVPVGVTYFDTGTHYLNVSLEEKIDTAIIFEEDGWNNLTIYKNYSFNNDSMILGLDLSDIRDVGLQIDYTLGNQNGVYEPGLEGPLFEEWLEKRGSPNIDTMDMLSTNSLNYISIKNSDIDHAHTQFAVNSTTDYPFIVEIVTYYKTKGTELIPFEEPQYFLNFTGIWDTNTSVYCNQTYTIQLPYRYEMTETTFKSPGLKIEDFTRMELDPEEGTGSPRADMIVRLSNNGTARARVRGPAGHYNELNTTLENYTAVVMASFDINYSADQSYDPIGNIQDANFTWQFELLNGTRYGMDVTYNYTVGSEYHANLTVREAGGNRTYRYFTIHADSETPVAHLWTNRSTGTYADDSTLSVNESEMTQFDSLKSTDLMYGSKQGTISEAHWDFDGDDIEDDVLQPGTITNYSYEKPGTYTLKMWVVDSVGHRSVNVSMTVIVNDTSPPIPDFVIYDDQYIIVTTLTEGYEYNFNASKTTDNYDELVNLTFTWDFGDNSTNISGTGYAGYNVTHKYDTFNNSYTLKLNVSDKGYSGNEPNYEVLERSITVRVDQSKRPNIMIEAGSFIANPDEPEEGTSVEITVTVQNEPNRGPAYNVGVRFYVRSGATFELVSISPSFYLDNLPSNNSLTEDQTKTVKFTWTPDGSGSRTVRIVIDDPDEPYTWTSDNSIESTINVREAGWKMPVIIGIILFLFIGIPIIIYIVRKVRAGELSLPRREKGEEEETEKKEVEKKEKKRL